MSQRIQKAWLSLRHLAIPANASQVQLTEMRRSFYCRAQAMLKEVLDASDLPEEQAMKVMDQLHSGLEQFSKDLSEGRA